MAGVILENLNIRKLLAFGGVMFLAQVICFLIGGLIAPQPFHVDPIVLNICLVPRQYGGHAFHGSHMDGDHETLPWYYLWPDNLNGTCTNHVESFADLWKMKNVTAEDLVFIAQFPLRRSGQELDMSRWFQQVTAMLQFEVSYRHLLPVPEEAELTLDVRLGYRNRGDPPDGWHELAHSRELRPMRCKKREASRRVHENDNEDTFPYDCDMLPLFTLGSCYHDYYLFNMRIPMDAKGKNGMNTALASVNDMWFYEMHQNGGFTKVWFALKTAVFPINVFALWFFHRRLMELPRYANVLEGSIFCLGVAMCILNAPIEWLSLWINLPFWLLVSDLRQGLFYALLLCFWVVFVGEHAMEDSKTSQANTGSWHGCFLPFRVYWRPLLLVTVGSAAMLIFDMAERGVQLANPFYSSDALAGGAVAHLALASVVIASLCFACYLCYLLYQGQRTVRAVWSKRGLLHSLPEVRQRFYSGIIYRFTVLLAYTLLCACLTMAFYVVSQINEDSWKWGEKHLEYSSAFITGVYGMWNVYVFTLLCLYAPSHKGGRPGMAQEHLLMSEHPQTVHSTSLDTPATHTGASHGREGEENMCTSSNTPPYTISAGGANSSQGLAFLTKVAQD